MKIAILLVFFTSLASRAADPVLAELFPAKTAVYIEIAQPKRLAERISGLVKGSGFENALPAIDKARDKSPANELGTSAAGILACLTSPEMLGEVTRFRGAALGITEISKLGEPTWVAVLLPGDSHVPGLLMRGYLSAGPTMHKVGRVGTVDLYQEAFTRFDIDPLTDTVKEGGQRTPRGPVFAYRPGLLLAASNVAAATDMLKRYQGDEKSPGLNTAAAFKSWDAFRAPADIFAYADTKSVLPALVQSRILTFGMMGTLERLLPMGAGQSAVARLSFDRDAIELQVAVQYDAAAGSKLADLLTGPPVDQRAFNRLGRAAHVAIVQLPEKDRLKTLVRAIDPIVKMTGTLGPTGSELLADLDTRNPHLRPALEKIHRVALATASPTSPPSLLLYSDDDALALIETALPGILELTGGHKVEVLTETVDGVKVRSLEAKASGLDMPIQFARGNGCLAIGVHASRVSTWVAAPVSGTKVDWLPDDLNLPMLTAINWGHLLVAERKEREQVPPRKRDVDEPLIEVPIRGRRGEPAPPPEMPGELVAKLRQMPPLVVGLRGEPGQLVFVARQSLPVAVRTAMLDAGLEWMIHNSVRTMGSRRAVFEEQEAVAPILLPPLP